MDSPFSRRALLGATGTALALSVAGCSALEGDSDPGDDDEAEPRRVAFLADIDDSEVQAAQEDARETQQEAQAQLQAGEIDEEDYQEILEEARQSVQEIQRELLSAAIGDLESHVQDVSGLTIVESAPESGVALGEGEGDAIVAALALDSVRAILDESEYDAFRSD